MSNNRYALHHDGTWFYYLPEVAHSWGQRATVTADGEPMAAALKDGWYSCSREASVITVTRPGPAVITGYRLSDEGAASVRYPLTLTVAEYDRRYDIEDDGAVSGLYDRISEPGDPVTEEIAGDAGWVRLDGEPPPADGRTWTAQLPFELMERREYLHLFPGMLGGFRSHAAEVVKGLPRVRHAFDGSRISQGAVVDVTIEVPFDRPVTHYEPARNQDGSRSRSRKGRTVTDYATRHLTFSAPDRIAGQNRAEAAAEWDRREAEILQAVANASVDACSHCHGTGHVITGAEKFEKAAER